MLVQLRHPNIVTVFGAVTSLAEPVLVMELFENGTLFDLLRNVTLELTARMRAAIARDVLNGMQYLHSRGVLHNDLKAANVLIDGKLGAKVTDFGLSTWSSRSFARAVRVQALEPGACLECLLLLGRALPWRLLGAAPPHFLALRPTHCCMTAEDDALRFFVCSNPSHLRPP